MPVNSESEKLGQKDYLEFKAILGNVASNRLARAINNTARLCLKIIKIIS